jgi:hypothetical protein
MTMLYVKTPPGPQNIHQNDLLLVMPIQDSNHTIPNGMKYVFADEDKSKYQLGKLRLAVVDVQTLCISATSELCQMAGGKGQIGSAVSLLQCSLPPMTGPRRVGVGAPNEPGCPEGLAQSSRSRGEPVSLGSTGGGWTGG